MEASFRKLYPKKEGEKLEESQVASSEAIAAKGSCEGAKVASLRLRPAWQGAC